MRWFSAFVLALYLVLLARLTLADPSTGQWAFSFADTVATRISNGNLVWRQTEVLANVALFVPVGFLLTLITRRPALSLVACLAASASIELAQDQWFATRVASAADVWHNGYGGALGVVLAWPVVRFLMTDKQLKVA
jgi:glycopeptide antibiotics resistance protein